MVNLPALTGYNEDRAIGTADLLTWDGSLENLNRVESAGRNVWSRVRPMAQRRGGLVASGALWVFMPCGLLYSALLVASLSGGLVEGMASMALFAIGSGISLGLAPSALRKLQALGNRLRKDWGTRIAGGLLALTAAWALWMDLAHRIAEWCGIR